MYLSQIERLEIEEFDLLYPNQSFLLEAGQRAARGLQGHAEIAADVLACHAQREASRRIASVLKATRDVLQQGSHALFRGEIAEQHHLPGLADDFRAHHLVDMLLQRFDFAAKGFQQVERDHADGAVFQGNGVAGVNLSRNVKAFRLEGTSRTRIRGRSGERARS